MYFDIKKNGQTSTLLSFAWSCSPNNYHYSGEHKKDIVIDNYDVKIIVVFLLC